MPAGLAGFPDWENTPVRPHAVVSSTLPSPRLLATPQARELVHTPRKSEPPVSHARPAELSLVAGIAALLTLSATVLGPRALHPAAALAAFSSAAASFAEGIIARPFGVTFAAPAGDSHPTIPVVTVRDLPLEGASAGPFSTGCAGGAHVASGAPAASPRLESGPDRKSLARAMGAAARAASTCGDGPVSAQVVATFAPSGVAREIHFSVPPPVALRSCVLSAVARARVPAFVGDPVTVSKTLRW